MNAAHTMTNKDGNIAALDGVRALAVALVMAIHYHEKFGGGWVGVQIFFVLSGFLITRILLGAKTSASNAREFLKTFWMRRALRIFPLYVLFLLIGEVLWRLTSMPVTWPVARPWLWTYSLNFGHMLGLVPISDVYSHFWSLAVEEQFYLLWPLLIWFLGREALKYLIILVLLFVPVLRYLLVESGMVTTYQLYFLTPTLLDAFAAGAALVVFDWQWIRQTRWWLLCMVSSTIGAGVLANLQDGAHFALWSLGFPYFMPHAVQYVWGYTLLNVTAALLLLACMRNELAIFSNRYMVEFGKISYGVYIIHRPVYRMITAFEPYVANHVGPVLLRWLNLLFFVGGTTLLAKLSYRYFETPFLRLKRYFEYSAAPK